MSADEPEDAAMRLYLEMLSRAKLRLIAASHQLATPPSLDSVQVAALHLRHALEAVALSSLLPHRRLIVKTQKALRKLEPNEVRNSLRKAHPRYWPIPQEMTRGEGTDVVIQPRVGAVIAESEWGRWFGAASDLLHERNPYAGDLDLKDAHARMTELQDRLSRLLAVFTIALLGRRRLLLVQLDASTDGAHEPGHGEIRVTPLDRVADLPADYS